MAILFRRDLIKIIQFLTSSTTLGCNLMVIVAPKTITESYQSCLFGLHCTHDLLHHSPMAPECLAEATGNNFQFMSATSSLILQGILELVGWVRGLA